jgi:mannose-1-phosphate guanylyltransferase
MRALLLSAGLGKRLRPITKTIPKCLVPIHSVPLLEIWLSRIFSAGISRVIVNLHYLPAPVLDFVENSQWRAQIDLFNEPVLLGTGGTLRAARELLGEGPILVVHADNLSSINLKAFHAAHLTRPEGCIMTMALFDTDNPQSCGIVEIDKQKRVITMHEKVEHPPSTLANAAVYIMEPEVLDQIQAMVSNKIDISTEIIPSLMGQVYTFKIKGYHRDIGTPQALTQAHLDLTPTHVLSLIAPDEEAFYDELPSLK